MSAGGIGLSLSLSPTALMNEEATFSHMDEQPQDGFCPKDGRMKTTKTPYL